MINKALSLFETLILLSSIVAFASLVSMPTLTAANNEAIGCCIDKNQGLCSPFSEKSSCEEFEDTEWYDDEYCNVVGGDCDEVCCEINLENVWLSKLACEKQSEILGLATKFRDDIETEFSCLMFSEKKDMGACVHEIGDENSCTFTSAIECDSTGGRFNLNKLCSNTALNTSCVKQDHIDCQEGRDEIFWFDSCGNPENIYSSDKDASWNNGTFLNKTQSCNPDSSNSDSDTCGNCNYDMGSFCKESRDNDVAMQDGDFTCRDFNCYDAPARVDARGNVLETKDRINGESWCIYDGPIGTFGIDEIGFFSQDLVGSRHYRYVCSYGEIEVDPCKDYRKEICVEKTKENSTESKAMCRVNMWEQCIDANSQKGCEGTCLATCALNPDCRIQLVNVDSDFKFTSCVPKYPPGFDSDLFSSLAGMAGSEFFLAVGEEAAGAASAASDFVGTLTEDEEEAPGARTGSDICSLASKKCTSTWVKKCFAGWTCINNCNCHSEDFVIQMNNLCVSLGDCGVYSNSMGGLTSTGAYVRKQGSQGREPMQPAILGLAYMLMQFVPPFSPASGGAYDDLADIREGGSELLGFAQPFTGSFGGGFNDITPDGSDLLGPVERLTGGLGLVGGGIVAIFEPVIGGTIAAIGALLMLVGACGQLEHVDVIYNCGVATTAFPVGNSCEDCDGGPLKPCSRYKCESLSPLCALINENTGEDKCITLDVLDDIPKISPDEKPLNKTLYSYTNITSTGFDIRSSDGGCINSLSLVNFGINTSAYSMCRFSEENETFLNMTGVFIGDGIFRKNHSANIKLPSVETLIFAAIEGNDEGVTKTYQEIYDEIHNQAEALISDMNIYVKCLNPKGDENLEEYKINFCVKTGPDTTLPRIEIVIPEKDSILKFGSTSQDVVVYSNEPVTCRWGHEAPNLTTSLEKYNALENEMDCSSEFRDVSVGYYPCSATLPTEDISNDFYFMCRDQPWLGENESRNIGPISPYSLFVSESILKIDSISPSGEVTGGTNPVSINLNVKTSGGAENGISTCKFGIGIEGAQNISYSNFPDAGDSPFHEKPDLQIFSGKHDVKIICEDVAGNVAINESKINLELDTFPPMVTRVFRKGLSLNILTNENAECYYNLKTCNFNIESGEKMTTALSKVHSAEWNSGLTYHIKCEDVFGNSGNGCQAIVRPSDI